MELAANVERPSDPIMTFGIGIGRKELLFSAGKENSASRSWQKKTIQHEKNTSTLKTSLEKTGKRAMKMVAAPCSFFVP